MKFGLLWPSHVTTTLLKLSISFMVMLIWLIFYFFGGEDRFPLQFLAVRWSFIKSAQESSLKNCICVYALMSARTLILPLIN